MTIGLSLEEMRAILSQTMKRGETIRSQEVMDVICQVIAKNNERIEESLKKKD